MFQQVRMHELPTSSPQNIEFLSYSLLDIYVYRVDGTDRALNLTGIRKNATYHTDQLKPEIKKVGSSSIG